MTSAKEEQRYKLPIENASKYDLAMELHLNASENKHANGCEVLYKTEKGKKYADLVYAGLRTIFSGRENKKRDDLYMLNKTKAPSIIVESFFCTCKEDYAKAKGTVNCKKVAKAITKYL